MNKKTAFFEVNNYRTKFEYGKKGKNMGEMPTYRLIYQYKILFCELERNWVEQMDSSLENILEVMGNWFTPEEVGFSPVMV